MKENRTFKVFFTKYLMKLCVNLKVLFLFCLLGAVSVLSGFGQQQLVVTGTVTDASNGSPLPGVNVVVKGTVVGALTGLDGKYTLTVNDPNVVLSFSFIGYITTEVSVGGRTVVNAALTASTTELDEVIVTGYGTQKKSDLTGSVVRVNMDEKATLSNLNVSQAMSGATAGVNVLAEGLAGSDPDLSIRGRTSLSASDAPLIVVDGIIYNGSITNLNVSDIESVDILKDASAAAVYGSRSANGVMLITTKTCTTVTRI
jgi:TonB-dependent SusC/RagA subfamily outer membrane receptor